MVQTITKVIKPFSGADDMKVWSQAFTQCWKQDLDPALNLWQSFYSWSKILVVETLTENPGHLLAAWVSRAFSQHDSCWGCRTFQGQVLIWGGVAGKRKELTRHSHTWNYLKRQQMTSCTLLFHPLSWHTHTHLSPSQRWRRKCSYVCIPGPVTLAPSSCITRFN